MDIEFLRNVSGIYKIEHVDSGKIYIGSAVDLYMRIHTHLCLLRQGKHHSFHLQRAWDKYGENSFSFKVIEVVDNVKLLTSIEQDWMDIYESYDSYKGFNICPTAGSSLGRKHTEESLKKMSAWERTPELRRKLSSWIRTDEYKKKLKTSLTGVKKGPQSQDHIKNKAESRAMDWFVISPEGDCLDVHNLSRFCKELGLLSSCMVLVAQGKQKHHHGWRCFYK